MTDAATAAPAAMSHETAINRFRELVHIYGLHWDARTPRSAYDELTAINQVLTEDDRRAALGLS